MEKVQTTEKKGGCLLQPPTPIMKETKWPTREVQKTTLEDYEGADTYVDEEEKANFESETKLRGQQAEITLRMFSRLTQGCI